MTGFFIMLRGFNFRTESNAAWRTIFASQRERRFSRDIDTPRPPACRNRVAWGRVSRSTQSSKVGKGESGLCMTHRITSNCYSLLSATVFLPLSTAHPLEGLKRTLEERVIDDIAFVIFSRYDPVSGTYYPLAKVGDYCHGSCTPCCFHQEGPASSVRCHDSSSRPIAARHLIGASAT